ncbi:sulfate transport system substrate-binding protein [Marinospirillum celere]|uniref:Sulfate transport system substrate-binding protein n=1 Tax=Marinospirillum celere TaxID=1122252 RepID=A0A1I1G5D7_9GAMM|nr:thiosulfate ABC transporter substrate-binding protein CysP [Marinospirillum celere]SFC07039.1 sulfate transport system substrate-binding protein [Marinospirillum celere]
MLFKLNKLKSGLAIAGLSLTLGATPAVGASLLNSSYDIARELFASYNELFQEHWQQTTGDNVEIRQSHGGSSRQAQAIIQGLRADVVTFNQVTDVNILHERGRLLPEDWQQRLPNASSPYYSTMAFLVRKDNPKGISNWDDLTREDVSLVMPNPKTSGNGRYSYLAALGFAQQTWGEDQDAIDSFMKGWLSRVSVFDTGGRGATNSFVERNIGDALLTFESEIQGIIEAFPDRQFEIVVPEISFLAEFPVAVVDRHAERNGNLELAQAYLEHLYSKEAQRLLAGFNYRVYDEEISAEFADRFPELTLLGITDIAGSWENAMQEHFANGGQLDQYQRR